MYLKSLEMLGFKSFHDARIEFPEGVTAIVGPNGSGKSNVVDAILWVLGEQSTKTLRSEKMEDVIFNGTEARKPLGMAEVSLIIGGLDRINLDPLSGLSSQLAEYQELMITRRLYRNGDSEYLINKTSCRLKDIRSALLDTRAGSKGHTVIAQGQIDQILNASPQDRRDLIEETAGIIRYKRQKAEALRKLEATQQNLLRVRDIISEVKKQLNALERQARQARAYQNLQQEAKSLEVQLLTHEYRDLRSKIHAIEVEAQTLTEQESAEATEQARFTTALEHARLTMFEISDSIARIREEMATVEQQQAQALTAAEVERSRSDLYEQQQVQERREADRISEEQHRLASETTILEQALVTLEQESRERAQALAALDDEMKALLHQRGATLAEEERGRVDVLNLAVLVANTEQSLSQLTSRMQEAADRNERMMRERMETENQQAALLAQRQELQLACRATEQSVEGLRQQHRGMLEENERTTADLAAVDRELLRQSEELAAVESHLRALRGVLQEDMGYGRCGEEEATALKACAGVHDAVAEWLSIPPGLDRAVEAILGERVRGWFVDGPVVATQAIDFLTSKSLGRGTFIPQQPRWAGRPEGADHWWPAMSGRPGVIGRAVDLIQVEDRRMAARNYLFDRIVFVESLEVARRLWAEHAWAAPDGPVLVTRTGEILDAAGVMTGGQVSEAGGLLQRRREVLALDDQRDVLVTAVDGGRSRREKLLDQLQRLKETEREIAEALRDGELRELSLQKDEAGLGQAADDLTQRLEGMAEDAHLYSREVQRLEQETRSGKAQLAQWINEKAGQEGRLQEVHGRLVHIDERMQALQQQVTSAQLAEQEVKTTYEHRQADLRRLAQEQSESQSRMAAITRHLESLAASLEHSRAERHRQETLCHELGRSADHIKARLVDAQERQAADMATARQYETALEEVRQRLASVHDRRMVVEVRRAEIKTQLGTVESTLIGTYQIDLGVLSGESVIESADQRGEATKPAVLDAELRDQLQKIRDRLDRMGPINLAA
ncbi:MAG TPA: chromosome segregation protein SMC, partial [Nitrospiraceae bacterium]